MNIPIFEAVMEGNDTGIFAISLVEDPATEVVWQTFSKAKEKQTFKFSIDSEEKHNILAPIMVADMLIYRYDDNFGEYYIKYGKDVLEKMSRKMLKQGMQNNIDIEHDGNYLNVGDVELMEVFIKNSELGINPKGFEDVNEGSLFGKFHVNNIEVWEKIKKGEVKGLSLFGFFDVKPQAETNEDIKEIENLLSKIQNKIRNNK